MPVTSHGFSPGILGVHPFVAILAAYVNTADTNLDHANKAAQAAAHGDAYHAADQVLQIAQDTAEEGGKVFIDAGRGAVALPGDVKDVVSANTVGDGLAAAGDVLGDLAGIAGGVGLALAPGASPGVAAEAGAPEAAILGRPFRAPNPARLPNGAAAKRMSGMTVCESTACAEIAERLLDAAGTGRILRAEPAAAGTLRVLEDGAVHGNMDYHEAYTDGAYVFDLRMSGSAIPKGDWTKVMRALNPGVKIR